MVRMRELPPLSIMVAVLMTQTSRGCILEVKGEPHQAPVPDVLTDTADNCTILLMGYGTLLWHLRELVVGEVGATALGGGAVI